MERDGKTRLLREKEDREVTFSPIKPPAAEELAVGFANPVTLVP